MMGVVDTEIGEPFEFVLSSKGNPTTLPAGFDASKEGDPPEEEVERMIDLGIFSFESKVEERRPRSVGRVEVVDMVECAVIAVKVPREGIIRTQDMETARPGHPSEANHGLHQDFIKHNKKTSFVQFCFITLTPLFSSARPSDSLSASSWVLRRLGFRSTHRPDYRHRSKPSSWSS